MNLCDLLFQKLKCRHALFAVYLHHVAFNEMQIYIQIPSHILFACSYMHPMESYAVQVDCAGTLMCTWIIQALVPDPGSDSGRMAASV